MQPGGGVARRIGVRWVLTVLVAVVAGCSAPEDVVWPTGPSDLVLRVVDAGGLVSPGWEFQLPTLSLYGDGLLIISGKPVVHRRLTVEGVRRVVRAAINAGLTKEQDYGSPQILDAGASIFTLVTSKRFKTTIVAPSELRGDNPAQTEARRRVHTFRKALKDLDSWLGDDIGPVTSPEPSPLVVFSYKTSGGPGPVVEWPYDDLLTAGEEQGVGRCQVLPAEKARALGQSTLWRSGDNVFLLVMRALLPDEKSCADIKRSG